MQAISSVIAPTVVSSSENEKNLAKNEIWWQVFFVPSEDTEENPTYTAFCPLTKLIAKGGTRQEAAYNWVLTARKEYSLAFSIPKYLYTQRKVWHAQCDYKPFYCVDFHNIQKVVGFSPETCETYEIQGDSQSAIAALAQRLQSGGKNGPCWTDEKQLYCTPLMCSRDTDEFLPTRSLTPHYMN